MRICTILESTLTSYCTLRSPHEPMDRNHLGQRTALSNKTECERYWEARTKRWKIDFVILLLPFFCDYPLALGLYITLNVPAIYLLTPWCRFLPEQLTGLQLVKKFPAFHGTQRFITALTSVHHLSNWFAATQEIPRISRNPKIHYRTHKRPPPVELVCSYSRNSPHFTEPEGSLPHSQASATCVTGLQLLKKFPAFHGTRRFITALTSVRHLFGISPSEDNVIHFRFSSKEPRELCRASRTRCEVAW